MVSGWDSATETREPKEGPQIGLRPKIYIASKTRHAPRWRELREDLSKRGQSVISTWINYDGPAAVTSWSKLWLDCVREASSADFVIVYLEDGDELRGAYVEMGCALAKGAKVFVVNPDNVRITDAVHHPLVTEVTRLEAALREISAVTAPVY